MPGGNVYRHSNGKWVQLAENNVAIPRFEVGRLEAQVTPAPPPATNQGVFFGHFDDRNRTGWGAGWNQFDQHMADQAGISRPVSTFIHGYSGATMPNTFQSSSVASAEAMGLGAMLNVKWDWNQAANGGLDSRIVSFFNSWPVSVPGMVTLNHEPENDGPSPANPSNAAYVTWANANAPIWKAGLKRFIDVAAPIIRARGLKVKVGGCLMDFSWDTTRWQFWDWWTNITPANINEVTFGIDAYWKHLNSPLRGIDPKPRVNELLAVVRSAGIKSFSFWETAVDRRQRGSETVIGTQESCATWWNSYALFLKSIPEVDFVCYFHTPSGPASGQAWLEGVGAAAYANICMSNRRPG